MIKGPAFATECRAFWGVFWGFICISSDLLPKWQKFTLWYGDCKKGNLVRDDNFRTLLPGEHWQTRVQWSRRFRIGFDDFTAHTSERPILTVDGIGLDAPVLI